MSEKIAQQNEEVIKKQLKELVCGSVKNITEALWDSEVSPSASSELNKKAYSILMTGETALYGEGAIYMPMWVGSICAATGAARGRKPMLFGRA